MSITLIGHYGDDLMVVNRARESTGKHKDELDDKDIRFIKYLAREYHISPFFFPKIEFRVTLPFFLARQWERHRIGTSRLDDFADVSEMSRRYIDTDPEYHPMQEWRERPKGSVKQGSGDPLSNAFTADAIYITAQLDATHNYRALLDLGVAPEQARSVFIMGTTTHWVESGSLHYWARFCDLRDDSHAQQDLKPYTRYINETMTRLFPVSWPELRVHSPIAMHHELNLLRQQLSSRPSA